MSAAVTGELRTGERGALVAAAAPVPQPVLTVSNLTVSYHPAGSPPVTAVDGVDLTIGRGERVALVGESGSGKSSLGLAIAGFLTDRWAQIRVDRMTFAGDDVDRSRTPPVLPRATPGMAIMFQDAMTSLDPVWKIGSQLTAVLRAAGSKGRASTAEQAHEWLRHVGLTDTERVMNARPGELSGGMRQRAMLAMTLAGRPALVIADEPTSALDASLSQEMMELLVGLTDESGTALLLITHDIKLCQRFTHRIMVMYGGRIVDSGSAGRLAETATHPYARALLSCVPTLSSRRLAQLPTRASVMGAEGSAEASE